jgi:prepilin-type N-terminal cleavage/methylation domain-containing protein
MIKRRGLTLIELLVTIVLVGLMLTVITSVYLVGFRTFREELASSTVQSDAQTILDAIVTDTKNGMLIEPPTNPITVGTNTYTTGTNTIVIRLPAINNSREIIYNGTDMLYDHVIYNYADNEIHKLTLANSGSFRYKNNGADATLDKNALSLSFEYDPDQDTATLVKINLSSTIVVGNRNKAINISGLARLRNHI